jgi:hypothetical protein
MTAIGGRSQASCDRDGSAAGGRARAILTAELVELERGIWIDGLDQEVAHEIQSLCSVMEGNVTDALLALAMFEQAYGASMGYDKDAWERDRHVPACL